jgi:hypothetical protein
MRFGEKIIKDFGNFENAIKKAMISCKNSGQVTSDHFGEVTEMVQFSPRLPINRRRYHLDRAFGFWLVFFAPEEREEWDFHFRKKIKESCKIL